MLDPYSMGRYDSSLSIIIYDIFLNVMMQVMFALEASCPVALTDDGML